MSKWLLGLATIAVVAVLHIFASVSTGSVSEETPLVTVPRSGQDTSLSTISAKPDWASLGRLGHELLTQAEHACVSSPS
jgi:hypothetical protein